MEIKGYKRIKKVDIKRWLLRRNVWLYAFILIVFVAAVLFMFRTVGSMSENKETQVQTENQESKNYVAANQSYRILVNRAANFITIYKLDDDGAFTIPYKTFRCSVNPTVNVGKTVINDKYVWRRLADRVYGHYTTGLGNAAYIHSVPYASQSNSDLIASAYNNLGNAATQGSIYLAVADAKWIYENCGVNSEVEIYDDTTESPVIALGTFTQIAADSKYDPTDNVRASEDGKVTSRIDYMTGVNNVTIQVGDAFDRWAGIYAVDTSRNDITSYITITGNLDLNTPGEYVLIYHLEDNYGTNLAYWRYITVVEKIEETTTAIQESTTVAETSSSIQTMHIDVTQESTAVIQETTAPIQEITTQTTEVTTQTQSTQVTETTLAR